MCPHHVTAKRLEETKLGAPIQYLGNQGARHENTEMTQPANGNEQRQNHMQASLGRAPIATMNGTKTRVTKGGWNSRGAGSATTAMVKQRDARRCRRQRRPTLDRSNSRPTA